MPLSAALGIWALRHPHRSTRERAPQAGEGLRRANGQRPSLARLRQRQGKRDEAARMLKNILNGFTEGLDCRDVREARAWMAEAG